MAYTLGNKFAKKIFVNGQFYFNLSSKMWSHVFWNTVYNGLLICSQNFATLRGVLLLRDFLWGAIYGGNVSTGIIT